MCGEVSWYKGKKKTVYHCTSGNLNPCSWGKMGFQVSPTFEIPITFERAFRRPYADFTTSNFTTQYWNAISHQAPAIIYDFYLWLTGRKLRKISSSTQFYKWRNRSYGKNLK
uniref:Uncharacterized protein n=1 Tax=Rhinopithecus roxellana TaxID=61622 RepID=A0A2K6NQR1_RHIRO